MLPPDMIIKTTSIKTKCLALDIRLLQFCYSFHKEAFHSVLNEKLVVTDRFLFCFFYLFLQISYLDSAVNHLKTNLKSAADLINLPTTVEELQKVKGKK